MEVEETKVLMVSWEYPPRIVGGLSRHVHHLSMELEKKGVEITILTLGFPGVEEEVKRGKLMIIRENEEIAFPNPEFISYVYQFNLHMFRKLVGKRIDLRDYNIIHAHDWLVAPLAIELKHMLRKPLITTFHSTEYGRRRGIHTDFQRHIHELEWYLAYESWKVIVCSWYMRNELLTTLSLPADKIYVIPNGVHPIDLSKPLDYWRVRRRYALDWEKIVLFVGRMAYEKGVHVLLNAARILLSRRWDVKFLIVGEGPMRSYLINLSRQYGIYNKVYFPGFVDDNELSEIYRISDIAVFPSLYEPFGIVVLEAMSAKLPVIVSDVGGFSEIVQSGVNGIKVPPGDPVSLANAIDYFLNNREEARRLGERGYRDVLEKYTWSKIAEKTLEVYENTMREYERTGWKPMI